jgi:hypothetical protein
VDARRRYRDEQRGMDPEVDPETADAAIVTPTVSRPAFGMPDVRADLAALPRVLTGRWMWVPFVMLIASFVLALLIVEGALPAGTASDLGGLYVSMTLPPTSLFVFFIGGFLASRASYLVGAVLGVFDAVLITLLYVMAPAVTSNEQLQGAGLTAGQGTSAVVTLDQLLPLWAIAVLVGILAAGFAAWYRGFLRGSQERARANRAAREREQATKAKEQARADRQAAREARRAR